jgi:hypothetical protein
MNENLDPTDENFSPEELDVEKKLDHYHLMILQVRIKYLKIFKFLFRQQI